ncbi:7-carboxy-7-deazaguanine synthase [Halomonas sp. DP5N14-9]|uniref:7-carboxy-7-deazaguanine synthase n=1 Tax=Halomonas sp. DP5N14-9 TaxID=2859075 RepID=UPI001C9A2401|nr:7-carboxy-7-deazaguanine synthase [Halomonas sp. DP5N14-9]MBY5941453.1 7-carboxy-7-deazaguanine synthase [Halomonas sp. DP5N14-9]
MYSVKEAFYTLQGEGVQAGRASVFCRFAGCNLWSGREQDRASAQCRFCDTDFVGTDGQNGGRFATAGALAEHITRLWPHPHEGVTPYVVFTGGEPLLQLDAALIEAVHAAGFEIGVETNGTLAAPDGIDWLCVSPKGNAPLVQTRGDELKLVHPQTDAPPERFEGLDFDHFLLQPMDTSGLMASDARKEPLSATVAHCMAHPRWRLSLQTHKIAGID